MLTPTATGTTQLRIAHESHAGARGKNNEDSYDVFEVPLQGGNGNASPQRMTVAVVADGVTSRTGGAQASQLATKTVRAILEKGLPNGPRPKQLEEIIVRANREIYTFAQANAIMESMSTTMVVAAVENQRLYVLHVGDSRAYLIRGQTVYQLTLDHTWVQKAIDEGRITATEAKVHPNRHVIVRYLGIDQRVTIDQEIIIPDTTQPNGQRAMGDSLQLRPGDAILLCTDGLTDQVKEHEIGEAVRTHWPNPQAAIKQLIELALKRQEPDNITVVLIELWDGRAAFPAALRKPPTRLLAALAAVGVIVVSLFLFGGNLMSTMGLQPVATPQAVAVANTAAQAIATATPPAAATPTPPAATVTVAAPAVTTPVATATALPPTIVDTPIAPTATLQAGGGAPAALPTTATVTPTAQATPTNGGVQPIPATATLAPSPTATATPSPTPTPLTTIGLTSPINRAPVTGPHEFQWTITNPNARATGFRLQIWPDNQIEARVEVPAGDANARSVTIDLNSAPGGLILVNNGTYNWQVLSVNATNVLVNSAIGEFSYAAPTPTVTPQPPPPSGGSGNNDDDDNTPKPPSAPGEG